MNAPFGPGHVIAGRYRLERPLGEGGMGSVWQAEHLTLKSPVAIKLLNTAIASDPEIMERFMREAQSAAALRGTYVVQIFDYGVEESIPFIAMEMLKGESLGDRLERVHTITPEHLARIFADVTRGLGRAHELGIIHRDLKPDNIFLVREGEEEIAKVLDFGIAKVAQGSLSVSSGSGTRTGAMLGTPFYMSPEQAQGNKAIDHRTDLWAMAIIAFECLTGRRPFESDALGDLVIQICMKDAPVPSSVGEVPEGFDAWFQQATQKDPALRFQSMRQMSTALATALSSEQVGAMGDLARAATLVHTPPPNSLGPHALERTTNGQAAAEIAIPKSSVPGGLWWALGGAAVVAVIGTLFVVSGSGSGDAPPEADPVQAGQPMDTPTPPTAANDENSAMGAADDSTAEIPKAESSTRAPSPSDEDRASDAPGASPTKSAPATSKKRSATPSVSAKRSAAASKVSSSRRAKLPQTTPVKQIPKTVTPKRAVSASPTPTPPSGDDLFSDRH